MSIPDLEGEANAPDVNNARAEEETMLGTPAIELQEAGALYEVRSKICSNSRRNPYKTIALLNSGCSTCTWSTF